MEPIKSLGIEPLEAGYGRAVIRLILSPFISITMGLSMHQSSMHWQKSPVLEQWSRACWSLLHSRTRW